VARSEWVGWLGRIGLAAQGICFTTIAALALQLAFGDGGKATDPQGAFRVLANHGWTRTLLVLLVCGFVAYALWRLAQALFNRGDHGRDAAGYFRRLIQLCQALIYIGFAVSAALNAVTTLVMSLTAGGRLEGMFVWLLGGLGNSTPDQLAVAAALVCAGVLPLCTSHPAEPGATHRR